MDRDLPDGFRWATAEECEAYSMCPSDHPDMIVVGRTLDADGNRYTGGESDLAVPSTRTVTKTTAELAIDDVFSSGRDDKREYEVWTTPVETDNSNGRLAFMAKDMTTHDILEHQAQATWEWEIR
jgi:hypothetical protein